MSEITRAALLFTAAGLVLIGLGVPLLRGRVPPNFWYGCRTEKTLSDEKIWYAVNRVTGRDLIVAGVAVVASALAVFILGSRMNPTHAVVMLLAVLVVSVAAMAAHSFRTQRGAGGLAARGREPSEE